MFYNYQYGSYRTVYPFDLPTQNTIKHIIYVAIFTTQIITKGLIMSLNNYYNKLHTIHSSRVIITQTHNQTFYVTV